ncbi:MAG: hypothetical protein ACMXYC_03260 [Candidatus Woesearchaeota archaeon]
MTGKILDFSLGQSIEPINLERILNATYETALEQGDIREVAVEDGFVDNIFEYAIISFTKLKKQLLKQISPSGYTFLKRIATSPGIYSPEIDKSFVFADGIPQEFHTLIGIHEIGEKIAWQRYEHNASRSQRHGLACAFDLNYALQQGEEFFEHYSKFLKEGYFCAIPNFTKIAKKMKLSPLQRALLYKSQVDAQMQFHQSEDERFTFLFEEHSFGVYNQRGTKLFSVDKIDDIGSIAHDLLRSERYADAHKLQVLDPRYIEIIRINNLFYDGKFTQAFQRLKKHYPTQKERINDILHRHLHYLKHNEFKRAKDLEFFICSANIIQPDEIRQNIVKYVDEQMRRLLKFRAKGDSNSPDSSRNIYVPNVAVLESLQAVKSEYAHDSKTAEMITELLQQPIHVPENLYDAQISRTSVLERLNSLKQ